MYLTTPLALLVVASTTVVASSSFHAHGLSSFNPSSYGLLVKRKEGYQPTQRQCGPGITCSASCGKDYQQCESTDSLLHCYDPTVLKQNCCRDGTGNACRENYYCTSDSNMKTWCCPDGMDLKTCAEKYGLTETLKSQPTPSATGTGSVPSLLPPYNTNIPSNIYETHYPNTTSTSSEYTYNPTYVTGTGPPLPLVTFTMTGTGGPGPVNSHPIYGTGNGTSTRYGGGGKGEATNTPPSPTAPLPSGGGTSTRPPPAVFTGGAGVVSLGEMHLVLGWIGIGLLGLAAIM